MKPTIVSVAADYKRKLLMPIELRPYCSCKTVYKFLRAYWACYNNYVIIGNGHKGN